MVRCFLMVPPHGFRFPCLVAPYCALPRDYLSDTPIARYGVSQHGQLGAIPPPPFSERFPRGEHTKWRCDTPSKRGISATLARQPSKNKANGCDTPLCDTISKRYCAIGGYLALGLCFCGGCALKYEIVVFLFGTIGRVVEYNTDEVDLQG